MTDQIEILGEESVKLASNDSEEEEKKIVFGTYLHCPGLSHSPCSSWQPGRHLAGKKKSEKRTHEKRFDNYDANFSSIKSRHPLKSRGQKRLRKCRSSPSKTSVNDEIKRFSFRRGERKSFTFILNVRICSRKSRNANVAEEIISGANECKQRPNATLKRIKNSRANINGRFFFLLSQLHRLKVSHACSSYVSYSGVNGFCALAGNQRFVSEVEALNFPYSGIFSFETAKKAMKIEYFLRRHV